MYKKIIEECSEFAESLEDTCDSDVAEKLLGAINVINFLCDTLEGAQSPQRWVPINDIKTPSINEKVWIPLDDEVVVAAYKGDGKFNFQDYLVDGSDITHWAKADVPAPPQGVQQCTKE